MSESTTLMQHVSFLSLPQVENSMSWWFLFLFLVHVPTHWHSFPLGCWDHVRFFSAFRIISISFFGPLLGIWSSTHFSFHLAEDHRTAVSFKLWAGYTRAEPLMFYPFPTDVEEPEGWLETLGVEMLLGLAPGLRASPGRVLCIFRLFHDSK